MVNAATGIITTIAGNGTAGFAGDSLQATGLTTELSSPTSVAVQNGGTVNVFIADTSGNRIREITGATGIIQTIAGTGTCGYNGDNIGSATAQICTTQGIAFANGALYLADEGNNRIRKVSGGTITTVAGNGTNGYTGDGILATSAELSSPLGVALDSAGDLFIAENGNNRIRMVSAATNLIGTVAGDGAMGPLGDGGLATNASVVLPGGVGVDSAGTIYINDYNNRRVRKISGGIITTFAGNGNFKFGGDGGPAAGAFLWSPQGISTDGSGNLYIADTYRVRKVINGVINTVAGNGVVGASAFGGPATATFLSTVLGDVVPDSAGANFYFSTANRWVAKVNAAGTLNIFAGDQVTTGFAGDGGPATTALLNGLKGMAFDAAGNLYLTDGSNNRIRKVDTSGNITTFAGIGVAGFGQWRSRNVRAVE